MVWQANLYVEPGFWTLLMASVAARAIKVSSHRMHLLISFRESTALQNPQLIVNYY